MPIYEQLREVVAVSFFVGWDETGFKLGGKKGWFWVWQTAFVTYIVAACSRSKSVISDTFPEGLPNSVLCSDRLAAQLSTITKGTQICLAHLLRDLTYLIAAEKTTWATDFKVLLKDAIALKQAQHEYDKDHSRAIQIQERLHRLLDDKRIEELIQNQSQFKQTITFFRAMCKLKEAIFPFLYDKRIAFDNNASERAIRMVKVKTKVSGQFKSLHQEFAIIRSVIGSCQKQSICIPCYQGYGQYAYAYITG
jgi:transposase